MATRRSCRHPAPTRRTEFPAPSGFPADALSHFDRNDVRIAKTASRRTLGYMNEMASELEWNIAHDGGLDRADINELNHALRRMLRNRGGSDYARPIELVNQRLEGPEPPRTNI